MMNRALALLDVLDIIFSFTDRNSNANSARVCKIWSDVVLNKLWACVQSSYQLFSLIGPIGVSGTTPSQYYFTEFITAEKWARFSDYARRVQTFSLQLEEHSILELLAVVARSRTSLYLLPNLKQLKLFCHAKFAENVAMFLHPGLKYLTVFNVQSFDPQKSLDFFKDVVYRSPHLLALNLIINKESDNTAIHSSIWKSTCQLIHLTSITLPIYALTSDVMSDLSVLPNLASLLMDNGPGHHSVYYNVVNFSPRLSENSYPALQDLEFAAKFKCLLNFFSLNCAPLSNLRYLHVRLLDFATPSAVEVFFNCLANKCIGLRGISIDISSEIKRTFKDEISTRTVPETFSVESIRPLCKFSELEALAITYPRPLAITNEDIRELVQFWPKLDCLFLNDEPLINGKSQLTLDILEQLAEIRPNLKSLRLYVNTSTDFDSRKSSSIYKNLKSLSFGASAALVDPEGFALFLNRLCPTTVVLDDNIYWSEEMKKAMDKTFVDNRIKYKEYWSSVNKITALLAKARRGDQEEINYLKYIMKARSTDSEN